MEALVVEAVVTREGYVRVDDALLQLATRTGNYQKFKEFSKLVDEKDAPIFLRDFLDFKKNPIAIDKVEPVESIVKHFVAGAMSFGALSKEAHEAICLAMNKLGARSNTGEGGEDNERFHSEVDGISLSSKTKQIASGRFGVTTEYLVNAENLSTMLLTIVLHLHPRDRGGVFVLFPKIRPRTRRLQKKYD